MCNDKLSKMILPFNQINFTNTNVSVSFHIVDVTKKLKLNE